MGLGASRSEDNSRLGWGHEGGLGPRSPWHQPGTLGTLTIWSVLTGTLLGFWPDSQTVTVSSAWCLLGLPRGILDTRVLLRREGLLGAAPKD